MKQKHPVPQHEKGRNLPRDAGIYDWMQHVQVDITEHPHVLRALVGGDERARQVVGQLLGIPIESGGVEAPLDPRAFQSHLVVAVRSVMECLLSRSALVLAFEDLHWADAASIELLTALAELTDMRPLMILVTSRPDAEGNGWGFRFHPTTARLIS